MVEVCLRFCVQTCSNAEDEASRRACISKNAPRHGSLSYDWLCLLSQVRIESLIGLLWVFVHHSFTRRIANKAWVTGYACRRGGMLLCFPAAFRLGDGAASKKPQTNWIWS